MKNKNDLIYSFNKWKNTVNRINRFDNNSTLLKLLYDNSDLFEEKIHAKSTFYRGRIFNLDNVAPSNEKYIDWLNSNDKVFQGYDKKDCGAPPSKNATEGRLNGQGIPFLYTCSDLKTVIYELRPTKDEKISVAEFVTKKDLIFADLTRKKSRRINNYMLSDLLERIAMEFSTPHYAGHNYYFTQYLAGQFINLKFDGIIFESSLNPKGENFVFFKPNHCEAISSKLFMVDDISIAFSPLSRIDFQYFE